VRPNCGIWTSTSGSTSRGVWRAHAAAVFAQQRIPCRGFRVSLRLGLLRALRSSRSGDSGDPFHATHGSGRPDHDPSPGAWSPQRRAPSRRARSSVARSRRYADASAGARMTRFSRPWALSRQRRIRRNAEPKIRRSIIGRALRRPKARLGLGPLVPSDRCSRPWTAIRPMR
jgi:hypothetical protein